MIFLGCFLTGMLLGFILCFVLMGRTLKNNHTQKIILEAKLQEREKELIEVNSLSKTLREENAVMRQYQNNWQNSWQATQENLKIQFENLATRIFEEKSGKFSQQSTQTIDNLLRPLKERLNDFQNKIDQSFGNQSKEQSLLKNEIERMMKLSEQMTSETKNLTKALKGDVKLQGNWGEIMLEKILLESGLRKNIDYIPQGSNLKLKSEEGGHLKPDIIVKLPENKHIIIDAKVSLTHYERFASSLDEESRALYLRQFLNSVKSHISDLQSKGYQDQEKLGTPDFTLMFMPIEGAYFLALQEEQDLHSFAWSKRIVVVSPATLFATLKTIASLWRFELQNKNAQEIAKQGAALYDKIVLFVEDMQKLGNQLDNTKKTYDTAFDKLHNGKGNILNRTERLKSLGLKTSKNLPKELLDEQDE